MRLKSQKQLNELLKNSHAKIKDRFRSSTSNMESNIVNETSGTHEIEAFNKPVIIEVHSYRHKLCDPDGQCFKHHLDSIVKAGILIDDSCEYVREVRFRQTKIEKQDEERTVVTISETD